MAGKMTKFVVYEMCQGGDVDGTGPERWLGQELGRFDTEDEAWEFADRQNCWIAVDEVTE